MEQIQEKVNCMPELLQRIKRINRHPAPIYKELHAIKTQLRYRRQTLLGSHISLISLVSDENGVKEETVQELAAYLSDKTVLFWDKKGKDGADFCRRFYLLAILALTGGNVGGETVDDILVVAETLVRTKDIFITVLKDLLPQDRIGELFDFTDSYDEAMLSASFEAAVLGALSVFLGVLEDPEPGVESAPEVEEEIL